MPKNCLTFPTTILFSNILKAFSASPNKSGFWQISKAMLQQADIPTTGPEKNTLTVLANLRNSFHANGMHNNEYLNVDIYGIKFEFCKGKPVECASWEHIVVIMRANISTLQSVLFSNRVSNLRNEIPDAFAAGNP